MSGLFVEDMHPMPDAKLRKVCDDLQRFNVSHVTQTELRSILARLARAEMKLQALGATVPVGKLGDDCPVPPWLKETS